MGKTRLVGGLLHDAEEQAEEDIHGRPEGLTATVLLKREIREFHDWLKWPGMAGVTTDNPVSLQT